MSFALVRSKAITLKLSRADTDVVEADLRYELDRALSETRGATASVAQQCGVSIQHISDIRYGRRNASNKLLDKLRELK